MKKVLLFFCLLFVLRVSVCTAAEPNALRNTISRDTAVQGYACARGDAWFYPDGSLNECRLAQPTALGDLRIPRGSIIDLWPDGAAHYLMLPHPTLLAGYRVRGGNRMALSRGAATAFYRGGELRTISLAHNQVIQGVPCRGGAWNTLTDPTGSQNVVEFYSDGKLESCKLAHDFSGFRTGERIVLPRLVLSQDITKTEAAQ
ncbi:MAG TPA: hypothetical protein VHZ25_00470 [Acidobacteriaceae bacterium]|jgi:hypothetical protein|nr:hypothetical protein [Acidobacteriaceae bacterium]